MNHLRVVWIIVWTLSTLLFTRTPPATTAASPPTTTAPEYTTTTPINTVTPVTSLGGMLRAATVADGYAYLGEGSSLTVLDLADPQNPTLVARLPLAQPIHALTLVDRVVYLTTWQQLITVDVSQPTQPRLLAQLTLGITNPQLVIYQDYAYVAGFAHFAIIAITQPHQPRIVGTLTVENRVFTGLVVQQSHAYLSFRTFVPAPEDPLGGVQIIDVRSATTPTSRHVHVLPAEARTIAHYDHFVYVGFGFFDATIDVLDVQTPTAPQSRQRLSVDFVDTITVDTTRLVTDSGPGLTLAERAPDGTIQIVTTLELPYVVSIMSLEQDWLYVGGNDRGITFSVINIQNRAAPSVISGRTFPGSMGAIATQDSTLYTGASELYIIDLHAPAQPQIQGTYATDAWIADLIVDATTAYLATGDGLDVVDVRDPTAPNRRGLVTWEVVPQAITHHETMVYIGYHTRQSTDAGGVIAIDVTDPDDPIQVLDLSFTGSIVDVLHTEDYLYALFRSGPAAQVFVIDGPNVIATVDVADEAQTLAQQGDYLYVGGSRLETVVISDPTTPRVVDSWMFGDTVNQLVYDGTTLYGLMIQTGIVRIPRIAGLPERPVVLYPGNFPSRHLAVMDDLILVGQDDGGLQIYQATASTPVYLPLVQR